MGKYDNLDTSSLTFGKVDPTGGGTTYVSLRDKWAAEDEARDKAVSEVTEVASIPSPDMYDGDAVRTNERMKGNSLQQLGNQMAAGYKEAGKDDTESLLNIAGNITAFKEAYTQADLNIDKNRLGWKVSEGIATEEDMAEIARLNGEIRASQVRTEGDPYAAKAAGAIAPFLLESLEKGGKGYLTGYMVGAGLAALAGQLGPQAGTPEEIITVPAFGHMGGKVAGMFTSAENMRKMEQGAAYMEMTDAGIDPTIARWTSRVYGGASAGLEFASVKILSKLLPGGATVAKNAMGRAVKNVLKNRALNSGLILGKTSVQEAGVEATQQFTQNLIEEFAAKINDVTKGTDLSVENEIELWEELLKGVPETFLQTMVGMGVTAIPGTSLSLVVDSANEIRVEQNGKIEQNIMEEAAASEAEVVAEEQAAQNFELVGEPTTPKDFELVGEPFTPVEPEQLLIDVFDKSPAPLALPAGQGFELVGDSRTGRTGQEYLETPALPAPEEQKLIEYTPEEKESFRESGLADAAALAQSPQGRELLRQQLQKESELESQFQDMALEAGVSTAREPVQGLTAALKRHKAKLKREAKANEKPEPTKEVKPKETEKPKEPEAPAKPVAEEIKPEVDTTKQDKIAKLPKKTQKEPSMKDLEEKEDLDTPPVEDTTDTAAEELGLDIEVPATPEIASNNVVESDYDWTGTSKGLGYKNQRTAEIAMEKADPFGHRKAVVQLVNGEWKIGFPKEGVTPGRIAPETPVEDKGGLAALNKKAKKAIAEEPTTPKPKPEVRDLPEVNQLSKAAAYVDGKIVESIDIPTATALGRFNAKDTATIKRAFKKLDKKYGKKGDIGYEVDGEFFSREQFEEILLEGASRGAGRRGKNQAKSVNKKTKTDDMIIKIQKLGRKKLTKAQDKVFRSRISRVMLQNGKPSAEVMKAAGNNESDANDILQMIAEQLDDWTRSQFQKPMVMDKKTGKKIRKLESWTPNFAIKNALKELEIRRKGMGGSRATVSKIPAPTQLQEETTGAPDDKGFGGIEESGDDAKAADSMASAQEKEMLDEQTAVEADAEAMGVDVGKSPNDTVENIDKAIKKSENSPKLTGLLALKARVEGLAGGEGIDTTKLKGKRHDDALAALEASRNADLAQKKAMSQVSKYTPTAQKDPEATKIKPGPEPAPRRKSKNAIKIFPEEIGMASVATSGVSGMSKTEVEARRQQAQQGDMLIKPEDVRDMNPGFKPSVKEGTKAGNPWKGKGSAAKAQKALDQRKKKEPAKYKYARVVKAPGKNEHWIEVREPLMTVRPETSGQQILDPTGVRVTVDKAISRNAIELARRRNLEKQADSNRLAKNLREQGMSNENIDKVLEIKELPPETREGVDTVPVPRGTPNTKAQKAILRKAKDRKKTGVELARDLFAKDPTGALLTDGDFVRLGESGKQELMKLTKEAKTKTTTTVTRAKDFSDSGEYDVNINGRDFKIYRDTDQFTTATWHTTDPKFSNITGIGETKAEAISYLERAVSKAKKKSPGIVAILNNERGGMDMTVPSATESINDTVEKAKKIAKAGKEMAGKAYDIIDVEARWQRMKADATGLAVKTFHSIQARHEDVAAKTASRLVKSVRGKTKAKGDAFLELLGDVVLGAENSNTFNQWSPEKQNELGEAVAILRNYFDDMLLQYENNGITGINYYENLINGYRKKMGKMTDINEMNKMNRKLGELERLKFVHLPKTEWFPHADTDTRTTAQMERAKKRRAYDILVAKRHRRLVSMQDLLDNDVLTKKDIDPVSMLLNYGSQVGRDMAMVNLREAGKEDGFVSDAKSKPLSLRAQGKQLVNLVDKLTRATDPALIKKLEAAVDKKEKEISALEKVYSHDAEATWEKMPTQEYSAFEGLWVDTRLRDALNVTLATDDRQGWYEKQVSLVKMAQFYNPIFMPIYDLWQAGAMGGLVTHPVKWMRAIGEAAKDVNQISERHQRAAQWGTFSKPFSNPLGNRARQIRQIQKVSKYDSILGSILDSISTLGREQLTTEAFSKENRAILGVPVGGLYNAAWNAAWAMDAVIRQGTFNYLTEQGMSDKEAAQTAAKVHADYASVPATTRKALNKVIFTPTFAISMVKVQTAMVNEAIRFATRRGQTKSQKQLALGALTTGAVILGMHVYMLSNGYEPDKWGRTYKKTIQTPTGPRVIKVNLTTPLTKGLKYVNWLVNYGIKPAMGGDAARTRVVQDFMKTLSYEGTPLLRTIVGLKNNLKPNGDKIFLDNDHPHRKALKMTWYVMKDVLAFTEQLPYVGDQTFERETAENNEMMEKELTTLLRVLEKIQTVYVSSSGDKNQQFKGKINRLKKDFSTDVRQLMKRDKPQDIRMIQENYQKRIRDLMEEFRNE